MKHLLLLASFVALFAFKVSAQKTIGEVLKGRANLEEHALTAQEAMKLIGKVVYVADMVYNFKFIIDSLKVIYIGDKNPNNSLTILFKGKNVKTYVRSWVGGRIYVSGKVILYKHSPTIVVTDAHQLGIRIQI